MPFKTSKTIVYLQNTIEDIFDEIWELSDPSKTAMQLTRPRPRKAVKDIVKIVHVTSGVQP